MHQYQIVLDHVPCPNWETALSFRQRLSPSHNQPYKEDPFHPYLYLYLHPHLYLHLHLHILKMAIFQLDFLTLWLLTTRLASAIPPTPSRDGYCFSYIIEGYDTCALIAKAHDITEADIEAFNTNTWAWLGCDHLYQGDFICLSPGNPPMPMALPQATCGPQVPGTTRPENWGELAFLNPCLTDACVSTELHYLFPVYILHYLSLYTFDN
jgi:hypothetical protein